MISFSLFRRTKSKGWDFFCIYESKTKSKSNKAHWKTQEIAEQTVFLGILLFLNIFSCCVALLRTAWRWLLCAERVTQADTSRRQQSPCPLTLKSRFQSAILQQRLHTFAARTLTHTRICDTHTQSVSM